MFQSTIVLNPDPMPHTNSVRPFYLGFGSAGHSALQRYIIADAGVSEVTKSISDFHQTSGERAWGGDITLWIILVELYTDHS